LSSTNGCTLTAAGLPTLIVLVSELGTTSAVAGVYPAVMV
jgi:hypothetical protein